MTLTSDAIMKRFYIISAILISLNSALPAQQNDDPGFLALLWNSRAIQAEREADYSAAMDNYEKALEYAMESNDSSAVAKILTNMSSVFLRFYEYDSALGALAKAGKYLDPDMSQDKEYAGLWKARADIYSQLGNYEKAIGIYKSIIDHVPYGSSYYFMVCHNLAETCMRIGEYAEATKYALETLATSTDADDSLSVYLMMAQAASYEKNGRAADNYLRQADRLASDSDDPRQVISVLSAKATVYENRCSYEKAAQTYTEAISIWKANGFKASPGLVSLIYGKAKSLLMSTGREEEAMEAYEEYAHNKALSMTAVDSLCTKSAIYQLWTSSNEGLSEAGLFCEKAGESITGEFISTALDIILFSKNYIYSPKPVYDNAVPDWKEAAEEMPDNAVAIEFTEYDDGKKYGAFVYRHDSDFPVFTEVCTRDDIESITGQSQPETRSEIDNSYSDENMHKLYDLVWGPLEGMLGKNDTVYFSPAGKLHFMPLEHLLSSQGKTFSGSHPAVRRMLCTYDMTVSNRYPDEYTGADVFVMIDYYDTPESRSSVAPSFSPLMSSIEDYKHISSSIARNIPTEFHTGTGASEYVFKHLSSEDGDNKILHISTHGFYFSEGNVSAVRFYKALTQEDLRYLPLLRSGLALAGANQVWNEGARRAEDTEDGILTGSEVASLDLSGYGLVVLAACQSALGDLDSDSIMGLINAFKYAGAGKILVSLWPINDKSASAFTGYFYAGLAKGKSPESAAEAAAERLRKDRRFSSPYHWAAYVLVD